LNLRKDHPSLEVLPLYADFTKNLDIPATKKTPNRQVVYFPGSTIGNFSEPDAIKLLNSMQTFLHKGDGLLIGIDLKKDKAILNRAYNDCSGLTAAFNRNILSRINRDLEGDFILEGFEHKASYNAEKGRVEMHLMSRRKQVAKVLNRTFYFEKKDSIHTESSYKYTVEGFSRMAESAGFTLKKSWSDKSNYFSVLYFTN